MIDKKKFYINGKWVAPKSPKEIQVIDPATEKNCAVISLGSVEDVNSAVTSAKKALETWAFTSGSPGTYVPLSKTESPSMSR